MLDSGRIVISLRPVKVFLLGLTLFLYLYGIQFSFMPLSTARIIILAAYTYFAIWIFFKPSLTVTTSSGILLLVYLFFIYWVILLTVFYDFRDISILVSSSLFILHSFAGGLFFAILFEKMDVDFRKLILFMQVVITVQALFIIIYFVSWDFREFTFKYIPETGNIDHRELLFRSRGLTHGASAALSVFQSFGLLFTAYLLRGVRYRSGQFLYLTFSFALILLSIVLTGRTGLLMLPVIFIYFAISFLERKHIPKNLTYFIILVPVITILFYFGFKYVYQNFLGEITTATGEDIFARMIRWYIVEFYDDGRLQSRTADALKDHWFFPESSLSLIFGNPSTWSINRISSDIGVVRMLHGVGLIGMIVYYSFMLLLFLYMTIMAGAFNQRLLIALLGIYMFIIELKEPFMFSIGVNAFLMLIFAFLLIKPRDKASYSSE